MDVKAYKAISYTEYEKNVKTKMKLQDYVENERGTDTGIKLKEAVRQIIRKGIYMECDEESGYKIKPIYGEGHWANKKEWLEYIRELAKDREVVNELKYKLKKLPEIIKRVGYSVSCENRKEECKIMHKSCYMSRCKLALEELDKKIKGGYEKLHT